jgi:hypothetical protein
MIISQIKSMILFSSVLCKCNQFSTFQTSVDSVLSVSLQNLHPVGQEKQKILTNVVFAGKGPAE